MKNKYKVMVDKISNIHTSKHSGRRKQTKYGGDLNQNYFEFRAKLTYLFPI